MQVILQAVVGVEVGGSELDDLVQVGFLDACHLVAVSVVLVISLVEVNLRQEGGCGSLGGTAFLCLRLGQGVVCLHEVVDDELPALVVGVSAVREVVVIVVCQALVHHEGYVLVEALQQEVCVGTQELHLSQSLLLHAVVARVEQCDGGVYTRNAVVEAHPHVVDVPVGGKHTLLHLQLVEHVAVARSGTALVGIVAADVEVPHGVRGVDVLRRSEYSVGRDCHSFGVL